MNIIRTIFFHSKKKRFPLFTFVFMLALPASSTYQLYEYSFGSGSANSSAGANSLSSSVGEEGDQSLSDGIYGTQSAFNNTLTIQPPLAPTFENPKNYYNKLKLTLNTTGYDSTIKYAIAISDDNFTTVKYVASDYTIGTALSSSNWRTLADWGASGFLILGLKNSTQYAVKIRAFDVQLGESGFGQSATAATVDPSLVFDIDVSSDGSSTEPPYAISFSSLPPTQVSEGPKKVWIKFSTNAELGADVYVKGQNGGLVSLSSQYKIASSSTDLATVPEGFGAQAYSTSQTGGGPLQVATAYNLIDGNVGLVDSSMRRIFYCTAPIDAAVGAFALKAKSSPVTPAGNDYSEIFNIIVSGRF